MALNIGNKVYRNLQEQVGYNSEQIDKIFSILDGIDYEDHVVAIEDISTPLTEEEMAIVAEPVAFLVYQDKLYFKDSSDSDKIYFSAVINIAGTDVITISEFQISVNIADGVLAQLNSTSNIYSKTKVDEQIANVEDLISNIGNASPRGVYATLADLQTAYPTGAEGIYLVTADGHWYYWDGLAWTDGGTYQATEIPDGSITKAKVNNDILAVKIFVDNLTKLGDFNDAERNRIYLLGIVTCSNMPEAVIGTLITLGERDNFVFQIYSTSQTQHLYFRERYSGTWNSWKQVGTEKIKIFNNSVQVASPYNDMDSISVNETVTYNFANVSSTVSNSPSNLQGTLKTFGSQDNVGVQVYIDKNGIAYLRRKFGSTFTSWYQIADVANIENPSPLDIGLFAKIGVIGDSYASGELYNSSSVQLGDFYDISWLQIMARKNGFTGYNFSKGGMTTTEFLTSNTYGLPKLLTSDKCGLYLLCLGLNDRNYVTLGSILDINDGDPSLNPNTFYGNYGKIISAIINYSPESRLIMFTMAYNSSDATFLQFNQAIRDIAQHYGIPCIETMKNQYMNSSWYSSNMYGSHPTAPEYAMMSKQFQKMIEQCMFDNVSYFRDYTGQNLS